MIEDDDQDITRLLRDQDRPLRHCKKVALDACSAWRPFDGVRPHQIVLDIEIPAANSPRMPAMMADADWSPIPKIIVTGKVELGTTRRFHELFVLYVPLGSNFWDEVRPLIGLLLTIQSLGPNHERDAVLPDDNLSVQSSGVTGNRTSPFDMDELLERCSGDAEFADRMIQKFLQQAPATCDQLAVLAATGKRRDIVIVAHRLKGAAITMAARDIQFAAAELEEVARRNESTCLKPALQRLESHVASCLQRYENISTTAKL